MLLQHLRHYSGLVGIGVGIIAFAPLAWTVKPALAQLREIQPSPLVQAPSQPTVLLINPTTGNDRTADGTAQLPFQTITEALKIAPANAVIRLAPGIYSRETGETFPLHLTANITLQGNPGNRGQDVIIQGEGTFSTAVAGQQNATIVAANPASLTGVTVTNPNPQGYGLWIEASAVVVINSTFTGNNRGAIAIHGDSAPTIRSNYFYNNGGGEISVFGTSQLEVGENIFESNFNSASVPETPRINATESTTQLSVGGTVVARENPSSEFSVISFGNQLRQPNKPPLASRLNTTETQGEPTAISFGTQVSETTSEVVPAAEDSLEVSTTESTPSSPSTESDETQLSRGEPTAISFGTQVSEATSEVVPTAEDSLEVNAIESTPSSPSTDVEVSLPETLSTPRNVTESEDTPIVEEEPSPSGISANSFPVPSGLNSLTSDTESEPNAEAVSLNESSLQVLSQPNEAPVALPPPPAPTPDQELDVVSEIPVFTSNTPPNWEGVSDRATDLQLIEDSNTSPTVIASPPAQRYRVLVEVENQQQQDLVRSLVPGAFRTTYNGQLMMQAGLFNSPDNAAEVLQLLSSNGLSASVEVAE